MGDVTNIGYRVRYVVAYDRKDGWPVFFRPNCERTPRSDRFPEGEGLAEMMIRLHTVGYGIYDKPQEFAYD